MPGAETHPRITLKQFAGSLIQKGWPVLASYGSSSGTDRQTAFLCAPRKIFCPTRSFFYLL